ncbi:peptidoglycan-binding protein [Actinomadura citrea]|uniref:peptidoglycan-binding protein n=1 Tax=Actinomadura citrea TaxID=46158 RepID=UPI003CE5B47B
MADATDVTPPSEAESDAGAAPAATATGPPQSARRLASPSHRRQRLLMWVSFGTAALSIGGMVASTWVKSPAQIAASSEPPKDALITASVERKVLQRTVIFRGSFRSSRSVAFTPRTMVSPDGSQESSGGELLVTKKPRKPGDGIRPGIVLAEVSYRPVFALRGKIPALRDLVQGASGPDIAQLQRGLAELGYERGSDSEGKFGSGTAHAVRRLYAHLGYRTPVSTGPPPGDTPASPKITGTPEKPAGTFGQATSAPKAVIVPRSEVMFVPAFPARISRVAGHVGGQISGVLLTVTIGGLRLVGKMDPSTSGAAKVGQRAEVFAEETGKEYRATVSAVGKVVTPKGDKDRSAPYVPVYLKAQSGWTAESDGQEARITVTVTATDDKVLAVPEAAISAAADGRTSVTVVTAAGERRRVPVTAGLSADGYVEVTPDSAALGAGDLVVVGK